MARVAGTVVEVRDGRAWIECTAEASACAACSSGRGCAWASRGGSRRFETAAALDGRVLQPGEAVELEADEARLLAAAARLYLPPLAGMLAGPALLRLAGLDAGVAPLLAATAGLLAGGLLARAVTRGAPGVVLRRP
ncbi:MAG TPA: SoxR reducing system RseC family protein [Steroidobacteraceae bacterium]|nr:SoxR reducing system RseC family protein [Steroidobacteraceae bacterium]